MSNLTLDHFLAVKREIMATAPPPMYAVKCSHATAQRFRASLEPDPGDPGAPGYFMSLPLPLYIDPAMATGVVLVAQTRQLADLWRLQEWYRYETRRHQERVRLITVLRRRAAKYAPFVQAKYVEPDPEGA